MNVRKKWTKRQVALAWFLLALALCLLSLAVSTRQTLAEEPESDRCALVVYTYQTPGVCVHCDKIRPIVQRLKREYPIESVYRDDPDGAKRAKEKRVALFPTFALVKRSATEGEREIERWAGSYDVERKIRTAFRNAKDKRPNR